MNTTRIFLFKIYIIFCISVFISCFTANAGNIKIGKNTKNEILINENNYYELSFSNKLASFEYNSIKVKNDIYTELSVSGYGSSFTIGSPKLPVMYKLIEVPVNATIKVNIDSSHFIDYDMELLGINNFIYPVQQPIAKSNTDEMPFIIDNEVYSKDKFTRTEIISIELLGVMRGVRLARIGVAPFQYNPVKGVLRVYYDLDVKLNFENPDIAKTQEMKKLNSSPYFNSINNKIFNSKKTETHKDYIVKTPVKYVIVSPIAYQTTLQPFIEWKTKKGFNVIEAYTNDPLVGTTNVSIKNYLKNLYNTGSPSDPPPSFVLFVGDVDQIPSFNGSTGNHVTDLYYCEYTNDFLPEVYYGRFSCTGVSDLQPQIDKTLEYEQYLMPDDSFLNEVVLISGYDYSMSSTYGNGQVNYATSTYFNLSNGLTSHTYLHPVPSSAATQIIQDVSNGCGFANYTAHGSSSGWVNPAFNVSNVASLQNANKYPLMIGNACQTNKFNDAVCFGEALLRAENKGALGYIGASNNTYWSEDFYWSVGAKTVDVNPVYDANALGAYDRLFHTHGEDYDDWYITQGQIIFAGNIAVMELSSSYDYYWEIYHLMGDPSLMVYFSVPPQLNCTFSPLIILGSTSFTVNTEPYAYVAISCNGVLHGAALADASGVATIDIIPFSVSSVVDIVATKQNRKPYFGTVAAASPTGPYVVLETKSIDDVTGNNNGIPEANENISISVSLKNYGASDANNVNAVLTSSDAYIILTDDTESFGDISMGTTVTKSNGFSFTVAGNIPDKHLINLDLSISDDNSNVWSSAFSITAHAPDLAAGNLIIDDLAGGNNNKRLDPGETIVLMIETQNNGLSDAMATTASLSSSSSKVIINNGNSSIGTINSGSYSYAVFNISVASTAIPGEIVDLVFSANSGQYSVQNTYNIIIGVVTEDWETGNLTKFDWLSSGDLPWVISSSDAYEGSYCIKSGAISNQQSSVISISAMVTSDDTISFYRKVSSETNYDFLKFFIDDVLVKSWSGSIDWGRVFFPVTVGSHEFKWEYVKDYSMQAGDDAAWIDFIQFPPCNIYSISTISEAQPSISESVVCYPNPVSNTGNISFNLIKSNTISISLYDNIGKIISLILPETELIEGNYNYEFNVNSIKNGFYYVVFKTETEIITRKIFVIK